MSYQSDLGKFTVPPGPDGLLKVSYQPERLPPSIKGALNPWEAGRGQQLRTLEDRAWTDIRTMTVKIRATEQRLSSAVVRYNWGYQELEGHLDSKLPGTILGKSPAELAMAVVFPPFLLPGFDMLGKVIGNLFGIGRKAKPVESYVRQLVDQMSREQANIQREQGVYTHQIERLRTIVNVAVGVKGQIESTRVDAMERSAVAYQSRAAIDAQRGRVLHERNMMVATLYPSRQRSPDAL